MDVFVCIFIFLCVLINIYVRRKTDLKIKNTNILIELKEQEIRQTALENALVVDTFNNARRNRLFQLSLVLLNIKIHYTTLLEMTDQYVHPEKCEKIKGCIDEIENQLREIGLVDNIKPDGGSILKNIQEQDFFKN
jgi:hypothetical protein